MVVPFRQQKIAAAVKFHFDRTNSQNNINYRGLIITNGCYVISIRDNYCVMRYLEILTSELVEHLKEQECLSSLTVLLWKIPIAQFKNCEDSLTKKGMRQS